MEGKGHQLIGSHYNSLRCTSMDYDENDFRSQNFQLVGEDNKLSSNLRSFALPKFDLDEHLRFDNLVEPEVLLGIQGQVNNWIDFPSGSSAIEFGSSAVESCSLSRHNNIWYEAMSSESVDLLLKSVGEEEMISNKAINMDDSSKERFHDIDNHVDLQAEGDNTCNSSGMDVLPSNAELIQNKSEESFSGLHEGQMELQGSSQLEVESRTFLCVGPTKGEISSGGKIDGDQYMAEENDPDEHPASVYECVSENKDLCDTFFKERHTLGAFMRTNAPNNDVSYSSVVASHSPDSITCGYNEGVKLVFASEKLSTGFLNEQHHGNISNMHGLLHENVQKESSLLVHSDENANDHSLPKLDALEMVKRNVVIL
ncbi:hypothetical protein HPP92_021975 [Vanilla planifolia]|uniref:Uncharacterized protein n=1 Tax=Vanilla planifolia TaxID=51239 RepID=A0A835PZP0_VANPL|nr:hypothetical protein HPP92_021975 [Vanilla planifolia]